MVWTYFCCWLANTLFLHLKSLEECCQQSRCKEAAFLIAYLPSASRAPIPSLGDHSRNMDNTARLLFLTHLQNLNPASWVSEMKLPLGQDGIKCLKFSKSLLGKSTTGGSSQAIAEEVSYGSYDIWSHGLEWKT